MDAFYASVELLRYPELRGLPVVIGGGRRQQPVGEPGRRGFAVLRDYAGRGVATTATYEARALGVHSAMGLMKAAALAPDAVLLPTDFDEYRRYSRLFKAAVAELAPQIEDRGIDEIYIDLTDVPGDSRELGQRIREQVRVATGLSCSIGITPNKLLSKICSDLEKPGGLTLLSLDELPTRIWPLSVKKINGVGPKAAARLAGHGIETIGALAAADPAFLIATFGRSYGAWLHAAAHGRDDRPVMTVQRVKSVSRERTFERDLHAVRDRETLSALFTGLCEQVADDLTRKNLEGRTIGIKLRYDDFRTVTRDHSLDRPTADARAIRRAAGECLKRVPLDRRLRLLGVRVGNLLPAGSVPAADAVMEPRSLPLFG
ncbi:MAG: DNA polymerase IV [Burkholderiales bacterium]|nr:DNA polymerase IV [Burkholderiales bacterium]